jgi:hypothetical protein
MLSEREQEVQVGMGRTIITENDVRKEARRNLRRLRELSPSHPSLEGLGTVSSLRRERSPLSEEEEPGEEPGREEPEEEEPGEEPGREEPEEEEPGEEPGGEELEEEPGGEELEEEPGGEELDKEEAERRRREWEAASIELAKVSLRRPAQSQTVDDYTDRLLKYIPAESVALYLTLQGIVLSSVEAPALDAWLWFAFAIGIIGTPLYLWRIQQVSKRMQLALSTAAFGVWVFALGGAFASMSWYEPFIGSLALVVFTFFAPLISPDVLRSEEPA